MHNIIYIYICIYTFQYRHKEDAISVLVHNLITNSAVTSTATSSTDISIDCDSINLTLPNETAVMLLFITQSCCHCYNRILCMIWFILAYTLRRSMHSPNYNPYRAIALYTNYILFN